MRQALFEEYYFKLHQKELGEVKEKKEKRLRLCNLEAHLLLCRRNLPFLCRMTFEI